MIIATTGAIAGQRIMATLGHVIGVAVRTRGLEGNIMAGLAHIGARNGDAMEEYHDALLETRDAAIARMAERAAALGANAVLDLRFDSAAVGHDMGEVVAYGTAVVVESDAPTHP